MDISSSKIKSKILIFLLLLGRLNTTHTAELITEVDSSDSVQVQAAKATEKQREIFGCRWEDNEFEVGLKNRVEVFYSKNCALFSGSPLDQVLWAQGIWDLKAKAKIGKTLDSYLVLRNKSRWGSPDSIAATSNTPIKLADATFGDHGHYISKQIFLLT